jgi:hypothetical protein
MKLFDDLKPLGAEEIPHKTAKEQLPKPMAGVDQPAAPKEEKLNVSDYKNILKDLTLGILIRIKEGKTIDKWTLAFVFLGILLYIVL